MDVPTPGDALDIVPPNEARELEFETPTDIGPPNVDVAVEVEIMLPVIN